MKRWFETFLIFAAALACAVTGASTVRTNLWWIRILDFPRPAMIAVIGGLLLSCTIAVRRARAVVEVALLLAAGWQLWRIREYTPLVPPQLPVAKTNFSSKDCFKAISFNVLQTNRDHGRVVAMLQREDPDVLLLMETDRRWYEALSPMLGAYPHRLALPIEDYGMIFASRLRVLSAGLAHPTSANTPTLYARLRNGNGRTFEMVGLHPRPPARGQDTGTRDRNIARASGRTARDASPGLAMGDFNDVPWSNTSGLLRKTGGYLDPRIGRGPYATFPSDWLWLGWPLDQIFVTHQFRVKRLRVLEDVGSDHRPLLAELCLPKST